MKFVEDPRIREGRKTLALAWLYFFIYLIVIMGSSYFLGIKPYLWGLPRWVAIGNIVVPIVFVIMLIFVVEKFIPDIPLTDDEEESEEKE
ncbi:DUF997 family protein [candidate division KSB1 bacterium]|nr:DUF997 family protein [candidate division KSB1 bacterium]